MMNRRHFLGSSLGAAAFALASSASGQTELSRFNRGWRTVPDTGMARRPLRLIAGRMPDDLVGTYFVNGPAKHARAGGRNSHWFDGDGMINAFRFDGQSATHEARFVETPKFKAERASGRFTRPAFGTLRTSSDPVAGSTDVNVANISVIERGGELWALWEGGHPFAINPDDLSTRGPVILEEGFKGIPFSAHPRRAADGTLWAYGADPFGGNLILSEIAPDGTLRRFRIHKGLPRAMVHDFMTTERRIIVGFPPYWMTRNAGAYLDRFTWHGAEARTYIVYDKEDFSEVQRFETPAAMQFHHFGAHEERDGTIRFAACAYADSSWIETEARDVMQGQPFSGTREGRFERIALHPDGRAVTERSTDAAEFPVGDPRLAETAHRQFCVGRGGSDWSLSNQIVERASDGAVQSHWSAPDGTMVGEHVVVPRKAGGAYLIGSQFDSRAGQTRIALFDANHVAAGPVALWATPESIPVPLHGTWVSRAV